MVMKIIRPIIQNPCRQSGDCYDRYLIRVTEMRESCKIIEQICNRIENGLIQIPWQTF